MMAGPIVSIICNTYNQADYIAQAIESFLMQKTDFPFEILVHDDASTDGTAEVVRKYARQYPEIVKPILQTENQYSLGQSATYRYQAPRAQGEYIAFCEGDDYWTDPGKLQLQYDFMESHPDYSACCHAYDMAAADGSLLEHRRDREADCDLVLPELLGNQLELPHFATFFARSEVFKDCDGFFLGEVVNDMIFRIRCALYGRIRYIDRNMSAYRRFVKGSWTVRIGKNNAAMAEELEGLSHFLLRLDEYTEKKYTDAISKAADTRLFQAALLKNDYRKARACRAYAKQPLWKKTGISLGCIAPRMVATMEKLREGG